jgi:hypothetical protein
MKRFVLTSLALVLSTGLAMAESGKKLSQAECDSLWSQANPTGAATIAEAQAQPYVSDFKAANPDNDGSLDAKEFRAACSKGLVSGTASSGASSGSSGSMSDK